MQKYNKAFVPLVMGVLYLINAKYGVEIPVSELEAGIIISLITTFLTWLVPNKE